MEWLSGASIDKVFCITFTCVYLCITEHDEPAAYVEKETGQSGPTYQDPNTIERQQGPTGDLYALPDKKSTGSRRQPPAAPTTELATYQDPNTIQHETAPTGALYAMPDKKQTVAAKQVCSSLLKARHSSSSYSLIPNLLPLFLLPCSLTSSSPLAHPRPWTPPFPPTCTHAIIIVSLFLSAIICNMLCCIVCITLCAINSSCQI